ncbi:hypothetical protein PHJA_001779000 [Phtheirospermum japonicum]|uniref:Uncharacterized protein n=1 Tax=Phtheirospermum japonicum TaxID=374723 RepID=A0A830CAW5_9LAMI|nr:hypothetical protein PHJA_001779000 [Phtheirospermum japonicum]
MGLIKGLGWIQSVGKKQCRSLYWRIRAEIKKVVKNGSKQQVKFQYDPYSYSLNFDDGFHQEMVERESEFQHTRLKGCPERTVWVFVVFVK